MRGRLFASWGGDKVSAAHARGAAAMRLTWVRYREGCSHASKTPCAYGQRSPRMQKPCGRHVRQRTARLGGRKTRRDELRGSLRSWCGAHLLVVGAGDGAVAELAGVTAARVLGGVRERTGAPVMGKPLGAAKHLRRERERSSRAARRHRARVARGPQRTPRAAAAARLLRARLRRRRALSPRPVCFPHSAALVAQWASTSVPPPGRRACPRPYLATPSSP